MEKIINFQDLVISFKNITEFIKLYPEGKKTPLDSSIKQYVLQIRKYSNLYPDILMRNLEEKERSIREFIFLQHKSGKDVENRSYVRKFALLYLFKFLKLTKEYDIVNNVATKLRERRYENQFLKPEEIRALVDGIEDIRTKVLIKVAFETSARAFALLRMEKAHINQDEEGFYYIQMREKGNKSPKKFIHKETALELISIAPEEGRIFQIKDNDIEKDYYQYWKILKEKSKEILSSDYGISFHWLRRSRAIYMRLNKFDMVEIQLMLGHKSLSTTQRYITKEVGEENKSIIQKDKFRW